MNTINKIILYTLLFLFLLSIRYDLTVGTFENKQPKVPNKTHIHMMNDEKMASLKVQASQGETVLSIVERINEEYSKSLDISQIMEDFRLLNNGVKPTDIQAEEYYYFPLYNDSG